MESENETRPLLHDFENETWRSKARKRCLRIPSEVAITGMILGLFFVVVTLLIVLENMQDTKESDLTLDKNLLASPFKYNKKAEDKTWQDKKDNMKTKNKQKDLKWDTANKGWKKFPDISGKVDKWNDGAKGILDDKVNAPLQLSAVVDDYGKDVDDSYEQLLSLGWKDKEITEALSKALKERKEEIKETERMVKSSKNLNQLWDKINDSWKKKIQEGNNGMDYQKKKGKNEVEHQKSINDEWKNKMAVLQSPKAPMKNNVKADDGWKKLSEQDKKDKNANKDGQEAENRQSFNFEDFLENVIEKIKKYQKYQKDKDKNSNKAGKEKGNPEHSSINVEDFMKNIIDAIKEQHQKGKKDAENQKSINDEGILNGKNVLYKTKNPDQKWKKTDDHWKTLIEYERNSYLEKKDGSDTANSKDGLQHSMPKDNVKWDNVDNGWKKLTGQGWKDQDLKEAVYKAWKEGDKLLQSATGYNNMKWKKVNDGWKKISNKS